MNRNILGMLEQFADSGYDESEYYSCRQDVIDALGDASADYLFSLFKFWDDTYYLPYGTDIRPIWNKMLDLAKL